MNEKSKNFLEGKTFLSVGWGLLLVLLFISFYKKNPRSLESLEVFFWFTFSNISLIPVTCFLRMLFPPLQKITFLKCYNYIGSILLLYFFTKIFVQLLAYHLGRSFGMLAQM